MNLRKTYIFIMIFLICILLTTVFQSLVSKPINSKYKINNYNDKFIIFFDDFNDNIIDYLKWDEIYTDGSWEEINQRCEFQAYEPSSEGIDHLQGIESKIFNVFLNPVTPLIISCDFLTELGSTARAGRMYLEITDGENWIQAEYSKYRDETRYWDSNDESKTKISSQNEGNWKTEIQVFSDRYFITMDGKSSDVIYDEILNPDAPLKIRIVLLNSGITPFLYQHSGFDNVEVSFIQHEIVPVYLFGMIEDLNQHFDFYIIESINVKEFSLFPLSFYKYPSGEKLVLYGHHIGLLSNNRVIGGFNIVKEQ